MQTPRNAGTRRIRELIEETDVQIVISRELCEETHNLRQANAELRELLRKNLLTNLSKRDNWTAR
jgi:hypothetical protein